MFAPSGVAHKRPRLEAIHGPEKKLVHPPKKICLGGGRVSGLSRQSLISSLLPHVNIVEQSATDPTLPESAPIEIHPALDFGHLEYVGEGGDMARQAYTMQVVQFTPRGPVTLTAEEAVRRYSEIHAENEAANQRWAAQTEEAAARWADSLTEIAQPIAAEQHTTIQSEVVAPTSISQRDGLEVVVATTTIRQRDGLEVDVAPTPGAPPAAGQEAFAPAPASQPIQASSFTQTVSSMLQSFAFEDTRSGYNDADDFEYPLN